MKIKKLFIGIAVLATALTSCKKENDDLIEGTWQMENIYIDGYDAKVQYAGEDSMYCGSYNLAYNAYYEVEKIEWFISGGSFSHLESGYNYNPSSDYCTSTLYDKEFSSLEFGKTYSISDEGKGDLMSVNVDGGVLDVTIISLDKEELSVEYTLEDLKFKMDLKKK